MRVTRLFRFCCMLWVAASLCGCSKEKMEEAFHLSRMDFTVEDHVFTYEESPIQFPAGNSTEASAEIHNDSINFHFMLTLYPAKTPPWSCSLELRLREEFPLTEGKRYSISRPVNVPGVENIIDALAFGETHCYVEYVTGKTEEKVDEHVTNLHYTGYNGFAEGFIVFSEIDEKENWVKGSLDLLLKGEDDKEINIRGTFTLDTEFRGK